MGYGQRIVPCGLQSLRRVDVQEISKRHLAARPVLVAGAALVLLFMGGCSRIREHQGFILQPLIVQSILPGVDNKKSVEGSMGRPTFASQFGPERWYYVSRTTRQYAFGNPKPDSQVVFMVDFDKAGNVANISDDITLNNVANLSPVGNKTPTLGRERSLFDEIFGNIGTVGTGLPGGGGDAGGGGQGPNGG
ncbi:MAG: outer membrane protein assembly factor BamE [Sphingobium sp.]|nr:outer membrane protein assembly factor BamE [Sphingobium sp.]